MDQPDLAVAAEHVARQLLLLIVLPGAGRPDLDHQRGGNPVDLAARVVDVRFGNRQHHDVGDEVAGVQHRQLAVIEAAGEALLIELAANGDRQAADQLAVPKAHAGLLHGDAVVQLDELELRVRGEPFVGRGVHAPGEDHGMPPVARRQVMGPV